MRFVFIGIALTARSVCFAANSVPQMVDAVETTFIHEERVSYQLEENNLLSNKNVQANNYFNIVLNRKTHLRSDMLSPEKWNIGIMPVSLSEKDEHEQAQASLAPELAARFFISPYIGWPLQSSNSGFRNVMSGYRKGNVTSKGYMSGLRLFYQDSTRNSALVLGLGYFNDYFQHTLHATTHSMKFEYKASGLALILGVRILVNQNVSLQVQFQTNVPITNEISYHGAGISGKTKPRIVRSVLIADTLTYNLAYRLSKEWESFIELDDSFVLRPLVNAVPFLGASGSGLTGLKMGANIEL